MCNISFVFQTIHTKLGICVYNNIKIFLVNSTEGTLVTKSISWKVSIRCDQHVHLWQLNKEYTTHTVFYLLISFRHLFIILIRIFNHYNLIQFIRASCLAHDVLCKMSVDVISVHYLLITYREALLSLFK